MQPVEPKLYVVVEAGLSKSQQAVQACHGIAQYCLDYPDTPWRNGTVVLLKIPDLEGFKLQAIDTGVDCLQYALFREPDLDNQLTALVSLNFAEISKTFRFV